MWDLWYFVFDSGSVHNLRNELFGLIFKKSFSNQNFLRINLIFQILSKMNNQEVSWNINFLISGQTTNSYDLRSTKHRAL